MNNRVVIDTSVMLKWLLAYGETGLDEAWGYLRQHQQGTVTLIAPDVAAIEMANLLSYTGIEADDARALAAESQRAHVVMFDATPERIQNALGHAYAYRMTVYDALFLSLAQEFECPLVTADRRAFGAVPKNIAEVRLIL